MGVGEVLFLVAVLAVIFYPRTLGISMDSGYPFVHR